MTQQYIATDPASYVNMAQPPEIPANYHLHVDEGMDAPLAVKTAAYLVSMGYRAHVRWTPDPSVVPPGLQSVSTIKVALCHLGTVVAYPPTVNIRLWLSGDPTPFAEEVYNLDTSNAIVDSQVLFAVALTRAEYVRLEVEFDYLTGAGPPGNPFLPYSTWGGP
jgi:hypothetical protein